MVLTLDQPSILPLVENLIAAGAYADERLATKACETAAFERARVEEAKKVIANQAAEISGLKGQIVQLKSQMEESVATLTAEKSAERGKLVTMINEQQSKITYLANRIDRYVAEINKLRAVFYAPRRTFYLTDAQVNSMRAILEYAHNIV